MNSVVMLKKCLPTLVSYITEDSAACMTCYKCVHQLLAFMTSCLNSEENIFQYYRVNRAINKDPIKLNSLLHFMLNNSLQRNDYHSLNMVNVAKGCQDQLNNCPPEINIKGEEQMKLEQQELDIKTDILEKIDIQIENGYSDCNRPTESLLYPEQQEVKPTSRDQNSAKYTCTVCAYQCRYNSNLQRHMIIHKNASETKMYECNKCTYQGKRKDCLKSHMAKAHKTASEVTMHKCKICGLQTRYKNALKNHLLTHKNISEETLRECASSVFETKHRRNREANKNTLEAILYRCEYCLYHTLYKSRLEKHMMKHKSTSEINCELCTYQTKYRDAYKKHVLTHKNISEVTAYKCEMCDYKTKFKNNLRTHMLIHKKIVEVTMYSCDICKHQTKHKRNLQKHMLTHKMASEITTYKCEICKYQTKYKGNLQNHVLIHKKASKTMMYKCEFCKFQCTNGLNLRNHMLSHTASCDT